MRWNVACHPNVSSKSYSCVVLCMSARLMQFVQFTVTICVCSNTAYGERERVERVSSERTERNE